MRGEERRQREMLVVFDVEQRVAKEHPLRRIKQLADAALKELSPLFDEMYSAVGRPSIPPERLLKASLLMALYTVRSERLFCEQLDYNFLFRWFLIWRWTRRVSTTRPTRPSRATARGCWSTRSPVSSSAPWSRKRAPANCSPTSTSRWTARWSRRGLRSRASSARTWDRVSHRTIRVIRR